MKKLAALAVLVATLALVGQAPARGPNGVKRISAVRTLKLRAIAQKWETVTGVPRAHTFAPLGTYRALRFWTVRLRHIARRANHPPHKKGWLCIHRFEGSWSDAGDPYWGGLQMDRGFMRTYAPAVLLRRGFANVWTPLEQMWVAERAHRSGRGYWPWPNTARACGLL